jgi:hypothetical protein
MISYDLNPKSQKVLYKLHFWLDTFKGSNGLAPDMVEEIQETIWTIKERGSYTDIERELLNQVRDWYLEFNKI